MLGVIRGMLLLVGMFLWVFLSVWKWGHAGMAELRKVIHKV
jgi:hypothetical protein